MAVLSIALACAAVSFLLKRIISGVVSHRPAPLLEHYARLGRIAPNELCPCGSTITYELCCRGRDIQELRDDVVDFQWKPWAHRSYAGRRRLSSMRHRLEDHSLPHIVLPEWVEYPGRFAFPIEEGLLRGWTPISNRLPDDACQQDSIL